MKWGLTVVCMCLLCFGCSREDNEAPHGEGKVRVLSTTAMIGDVVRKIGGEEVDHCTLIVGDINPHSYELVKGDDEKLLHADVIFYNGLGLEHGASLVYHLNSHPQAVPLGDLLFEKDASPFIFIDGQLDPHFWMDVGLFSQVIDPIVKALSEKDRAHALLFAERGERLRKEMMAKDRLLLEKMGAIPSERRYLVSSHDAFYYFVKKYLSQGEENWRERFMAPEGLAPDGQMSILDIQAVSDFLCTHHVEVVFSETNVNQDALKKIVSICRKKGLDVKIAATPLYGDTMGGRGTGADTYLEMIEHNVHTLKDNLGDQ